MEQEHIPKELSGEKVAYLFKEVDAMTRLLPKDRYMRQCVKNLLHRNQTIPEALIHTESGHKQQYSAAYEYLSTLCDMQQREQVKEIFSTINIITTSSPFRIDVLVEERIVDYLKSREIPAKELINNWFEYWATYPRAYDYLEEYCKENNNS